MTDLLIAGSGNRGPAPDPGAPLLEVITQPLYSSVAFGAAAIPNEIRAFQYQVGDTVPGVGAGAIASTLLHTNMDQAGSLSTPKVFEITGLRQVMGNIEADLIAGVSHPGTASDATTLEDLVRITHGTHMALHVGTKDYAQGPGWLFPGNVGLSGVTGQAGTDTAAIEQPIVQATNSAGKYMGLNPYTIFIPSQQSFHVKIRAPGATAPTLVLTRLLWIFLDGRLGREAQ